MKFRLIQVLACLTLLSGCAILQRESPEKRARAFMMAFQQSLSQPDAEVLKFFKSEQSSESLLAAINLLQNEDSELVECLADFNSMQLAVESKDESIKKVLNLTNSVVKVTVPIQLQANQIDESMVVDLVFRLKEQSNQFVIYQLEAENLYNTFALLKHDIQYAQHQLDEVENRGAIYATADSLREKYDHVAWYAKYNNEIYFYVVNGDWSEEFLYSPGTPRPDFKMGLVNSGGEEILPVNFNMIGTIGAEVGNAVEVLGPEGYGYYSLEGDELVSPSYDQVIPYSSQNFWIVQDGDSFGWIDGQKKFTNGFPDHQTEKSIKEFSYLPSGITINEGAYALCETPTPDGAGSGLFISPSYWVQSGLLEEFKFGITTTTATDAPIGGWTEYIEIGETLFQSLGENLGVIISSFRERYLEGREEFYQSNKVLFTDGDQHTVNSFALGGDDLAVKKISDQLIELSATRSLNPMEMGIAEDPANPRYFLYYRVEGLNLTPLESNRSCPETEFVKLDSSYIMGDLSRFNYDTNSREGPGILPAIILQNMRNEILAEYGYLFPDENDLTKFNSYRWYDPRFETEAEFEANLSEVDRHNLNFLAKILALRKESI